MITPIVFGGNSNPLLVRAICKELNVEQGKALVTKFSDTEERIEILENVRRREVFVVQSSSRPAAANLMELCLIIGALKHASASRITAVIPYFGYARQDRIPQNKRTPISAGFAARMIVLAGAHRVILMELHANQTQDAFGVPVDRLYSYPVLADHMKGKLQGEAPENIIFISPDAGGMTRARKYAKSFHRNTKVGMIDKRRDNPNESEVMNVVGKVKGKICILVDDIADTFGTMKGAITALRGEGARDVLAYCTHPVLSGSALDNIQEVGIPLVVTDTIPLSDKAEASGCIEVVPVAKVFAEAITKSCDGGSISAMFE